MSFHVYFRLFLHPTATPLLPQQHPPGLQLLHAGRDAFGQGTRWRWLDPLQQAHAGAVGCRGGDGWPKTLRKNSGIYKEKW